MLWRRVRGVASAGKKTPFFFPGQPENPSPSRARTVTRVPPHVPIRPSGSCDIKKKKHTVAGLHGLRAWPSRRASNLVEHTSKWANGSLFLHDDAAAAQNRTHSNKVPGLLLLDCADIVCRLGSTTGTPAACYFTATNDPVTPTDIADDRNVVAAERGLKVYTKTGLGDGGETRKRRISRADVVGADGRGRTSDEGREPAYS